MAFQGYSDNTYEIYLNSEFDKLNGDTNADWTTEFKTIALNPNKYYQVGINSLQVPNTCPQFHQNDVNFIFSNNDFTFNKIYDNTNVFETLQDMLAYITTIFTSEISGIVVSQDEKTKKTKITNNSGASITLNLTDENSKNFFRKIGFTSSSNINIPNTQSVISSSYPTILGTSRFYLVCEEIKNNSYSGRDYNNWSIMMGINCNVGFGSYCNYQTNNNIYFHDLNTSSSINNLSFRVLDDRFRPVKLQGGGVQLSIYLREI